MKRASVPLLMALSLSLPACTINIGGRNQATPTPSVGSTATSSPPGSPSAEQVVGSGKVATESRQVSGFNQVRFRGSGDVVIERTGTESLTIEAEDNIIPVLTSEVINGQLNLGQKPGTSIITYKPIVYHVTVKDLTAIEGSGSGSADIKGVDTDTFTADANGSIQVKVAGKAANHNISISGSGEYNGDSLAAKHVQVRVSGSANVLVNAADSLDVIVSGSGSVIYSGSPSVSEKISGSGSIQKK